MRAELALLLRCATALAFASLQAAEPGHALRQEGAGIVFHYGVMPAQFETRRPGMSQPASAESEYRVSPEGRR